VFGQIYTGNNKLWDKVGGFQCKNANEFLGKCKELTRPKSNQWALEPFYVNAVHMFGQWYGVPNGWKLDKGGSLTNRFETDEYAAAIAFGAKVRKAGYFYPDPNLSDSHTPYLQGKIAAIVNSGPGAIGGRSLDRQTDPSIRDELLIPFGHGGGPGLHDLGYGTIGFTAIKKSNEKRVRMLLQMLDYLAAPFGTTEWLFINYGNKGEHFTYDARGVPTLTKKGTLQVQGVESGLGTMSSPSQYVYDALYPDDVDYLDGIQKKLLTIGQADPTIGYYSDTYTKVGGKLTTDFYDTVNDLVAGRKPMSELKEAISRWKTGGGDAMRHEYEQAIGQHH
jgi:putative aldouronate transport system substrate-binding protein